MSDDSVARRLDTQAAEYTRHLEQTTIRPRGWRKLIDPQRPYRWNIRRLQLGRVLDVGCGVGRNLINLDRTSVGVDHNVSSVAVARARGLTAFESDEFEGSDVAAAAGFESLLFAHVLEHMTEQEAIELVAHYLWFTNAGATVVVICPQRRGFASDRTHVTFMSVDSIEAIMRACGISPNRSFSFPFPPWAGRVFTHNETIVVGVRSAAPTQE